MAKRGRPRKPGRRYANGRLKPAATIDQGNARARAQRDRFGLYAVDAIGRAYISGLLGIDTTARAMLDTGRAIAFAYHSTYEIGRYRCALSDRRHGSFENVERSLALAKFADERLGAVKAKGPHVRAAFDELVLIEHPDAGPEWLDRIIEQRHGASDLGRLALAIEGLETATCRAE